MLFGAILFAVAVVFALMVAVRHSSTGSSKRADGGGDSGLLWAGDGNSGDSSGGCDAGSDGGCGGGD